MSIVLVAIVRDEEKYLQKMLDSALPHCSHAVICDTGSKDNTAKIADKAFFDSHIVGTIHLDQWVNFSHNRNLAIERARKTGCEWMLLMDGDEELVIEGGGQLYDRLGIMPHGYNIQHGDSFRWYVPRLVRINDPAPVNWHYVGACHEYLTADGVKAGELPILPGVRIRHLEDGARCPAKLQRNLDLLTAEYESDKQNPRTLFYLAETYFYMGHYMEAETIYNKRVVVGGWDQETFYSAYRGALCHKSHGQSFEQLITRAWNMRPSRVEPLLELARYYRASVMHNASYMVTSQAIKIPMTTDILFVDAQAYDWDVPIEHGIACMATGRIKEAVETFAPLIGKPGPEHLKQIARENLKLALSKLN